MRFPSPFLLPLVLICACDASVPGDFEPESVDHAAEVAPAESPSLVDRIEAWNAGLSGADRHAKYCKMAQSRFVFFRGTNHLFWEDVFGDARLAPLASDDTEVWLQGDLHIANFGAYDNDEGAVVYSLNDFDEAIIGDYQYDLWRLATSIELVARENGGLSASATAGIVDRLIAGYLGAMNEHMAGDSENDAVFDAAALEQPLRGFIEDVAADSSRTKALNKWTDVVDGDRVFDLSLDRLAAVDASRDAEIREAMIGYGDSLSGGLNYDPDFFAVKGVAQRLLAGTGSLGTLRYYVLIEGDSGGDNDDHILDVKRQAAPTAYHFADPATKDRYDATFADHAVRHATAYKALEVHTDDFLGYMALSDGSYSVRERSVFKESFEHTELADLDDYRQSATHWGEILAAGHARADVDFDALLIPVSVDRTIAELTAGRELELTDRIAELAREYADRVDSDWLEFVDQLAPTDCASEN